MTWETKKSSSPMTATSSHETRFATTSSIQHRAHKKTVLLPACLGLAPLYVGIARVQVHVEKATNSNDEGVRSVKEPVP